MLGMIQIRYTKAPIFKEEYIRLFKEAGKIVQLIPEMSEPQSAEVVRVVQRCLNLASDAVIDGTLDGWEHSWIELEKRCLDGSMIILDTLSHDSLPLVRLSFQSSESAYKEGATREDIKEWQVSELVEYVQIKLSKLTVGRSSMTAIIEAVAVYYNLTTRELTGSRKYKSIVHARQVAYFLCRTIGGYSYPEIGLAFGKRDHTTVRTGCAKIEGSLSLSIASEIADIKLKLELKETN